MESSIEQYLWGLMDDLGIDLEYDNKASELVDDCVKNICSKSKKHFLSAMRKSNLKAVVEDSVLKNISESV